MSVNGSTRHSALPAIESLERRQLLAQFMMPGFAEITQFRIPADRPDLQLVAPTAVEFDYSYNAANPRVFLIERAGKIKVFQSLVDNEPHVTDITANVAHSGDRGLTGLALDPNFATNKFVWVMYSRNGSGYATYTRVSRFTFNENTWLLGNETVWPELENWYANDVHHVSGHIAFGPDNMLYATAGDGATPEGTDITEIPGLDSAGEGGSLRAQDAATPADATHLSGSIIRIDPSTRNPATGNPFTTGDTNRKRIIAFGMRNPHRFTFRPNTSEVWIGDVGRRGYEEINRITNVADPVAENFGWPAYEGGGTQVEARRSVSDFDLLDKPILESLYENPAADTKPFFFYDHDDYATPPSDPNRTAENTGAGASITGLSFHVGTAYGSTYDNALFFADYSRNAIYVMTKDASGLPDPSTARVFYASDSTGPGDPGAGPIELQVGPNGDIFYVDINRGRLVRLVKTSNPTARITTSTPIIGATPLNVTFNGSTSSDPAGQALTYAWDLDGDSAYDDSTAAAPSWTYNSNLNNVIVGLRVTNTSLNTATTSIVVYPGDSAPNPTLTVTPTNGGTQSSFKIGDTFNWSAPGVDSWEIRLNHSGHVHVIDSGTGASGILLLKEHEMPYTVTLRVFDKSSRGYQMFKDANFSPKLINLNFKAGLTGLKATIEDTELTFSSSTNVVYQAVAGATVTLAAAMRQQKPGSTTTASKFSSWSDSGASTHDIVVPSTGSPTYIVNYVDGTQAAWNPLPYTVNEQIEAEAYDGGGMFQAYYDVGSLNFGGGYRPTEAVDTEATTDSGANQMSVSYAVASEWIEYTVNVPTAGSYTLRSRVSNKGTGGQFRVRFNGTDKTGLVTVPNTGNWSTYLNVDDTVSLSAGVQVMRVEMVTNSSLGFVGNFNWFELIPSAGLMSAAAPSTIALRPAATNALAASAFASRKLLTDEQVLL
jgi:hypothetical protein